MKNLAGLTYPGRLIIIGADPTGSAEVVVYAVTGRSPSSQARRLELSGEAVWTKPTDPDLVKTGNADLLVYPALVFGAGIAVSNGKQTSALDLASDENPVAVLAKGLESWSYEPDEPIYTPRITGCLLRNRRAGLSLIRRGPDGAAERSFFEFSPLPGRGKFIATYTGPNENPLPVFRGEPLDVDLEGQSPEATAKAVYTALAPEGPAQDFRVAVACVYLPREPGRRRRVAILNRHERTGP